MGLKPVTCTNIMKILVFISLLVNFTTALNVLNDYIRHYEGLTYDKQTVQNSHHRTRRSADNPYISLKFQALERSFSLRLRRDTSLFSKDFQSLQADGSLRDHDTSYIYEGYVKGEPKSRVSGSLVDGVFAGRIKTNSGTYYVEKSEFYFKDAQPFHSIIYHEKHVDTEPARLKRGLTEGQCGSAESSVYEWMESIQNSATGKKFQKRSASSGARENLQRSSPYQMYSAAANRRKRETPNLAKTCTLFLQTDPQLWNYMKDDLNYGDSRANEEITALLAHHVDGIKDIYMETLFSSDHSGYSFVVRRVQIMNSSMCDDRLTVNRFCERNIDVTNFLNLNSLSNHNDYCLAYMFTYRDFTGGTLGLAWVGANSRAAGGICEKYKEYQENGVGVFKSLNTGIVTIVNYGNKVPLKVSTLTFAHEVGHNFGAPHDKDDECTPYTSRSDPDGNYIMFASATSGDRPNNRRFSSCSKESIAEVLDAVVNERHGKDNCFVTSQEQFCGNGIVEEDEQCDCGHADDCRDQCCYGHQDNSSAECTLKNVACSPTQGPCCTSECTYIASEPLMECEKDTDCKMSSTCNGINARCPEPEHKPNNTRCNENTQICMSGNCQGSICSLIEDPNGEWEQCYLVAPENDRNFDKGNLCYVSCKNPESGECVSSSRNDEALERSQNEPFKTFLDSMTLDSGIRLPPGAPCDDYRGYCDVFSKCRGVDADGPLAKLKKLFFSSETYDIVRRWVTVHWWAVMLAGIGLILGMAAFIACCAVHTPSSNPNKPPARRVSDTLRRRPRNRAQGPPPGYGQGRGGNAGASGSGPSSRPPPYNQRGEQYAMPQMKSGMRV